MQWSLLSVILLGLVPNAVYAQNSRAKAAAEIFRVGARLFTGAAAAESMRRAGNSSVGYNNAREEVKQSRQEYEKIRRQRIQQVSEQFNSQNLSHERNTIYSVFLNLDYKNSNVYWADFFSYPDIFFVVEVEGVGEFVLPSIRNEFRGGPALERVVLPSPSPGTRVVVRILDDDTNSNEIWNSILRSKINYHFSVDNQDIYACNAVGVQATFSGSFRLLDSSKHLVLDAPDHLASVVFQVPETLDSVWVVDGELHDTSNRPAGRVQFAQVWNAQSELASLERELAQRVAHAEEKEASLFGWLVFWGVVGIACFVWFVKSFESKQGPHAGATASQ